MPNPYKVHHPDTIKRAAELGMSGPAQPLGIDDVQPDPTKGLTFEPIGRRLLVRRADTDETLTEGGIVMPAVVDRPTFVSEIVALGEGLQIQGLLARAMAGSILATASASAVDPETDEELSLSPDETLGAQLEPEDYGALARFLSLPQFTAAIGDLVLHSRHAGYEIEVDGEKLKLMADTDVLGLWRRPNPDWSCPECGSARRTDEDGCCLACGQDCNSGAPAEQP